MSRLVIQSVELENFKSYGGKKIVGPFHPRFTCVVGSNGSGKSNIVDAMLFVFGKRAQQLRMKRVQDLIHSSASRPNCVFCKVVVNFLEVTGNGGRNAEDFEIVPNSKLSIGREAKSDGTSKFILNNSTVKREVIVEKLKQHGIDLEHNRFLILQGEVELISQLKPIGKRNQEHQVTESGLLEFLEDIIGTSEYLSSIEKLSKASQETLEELKSASELTAVSTKKIEEMKSTVESSKNQCILELNRCRWSWLKMMSAYIEKKNILSEVEAAIVLNKDDYTAWRESTSSSRSEEEALENEFTDLSKNVKRHQKLLSKLESKYHELESEFASVNKKILQIKQEKQEALGDIEDLKVSNAKRIKQLEQEKKKRPALVENMEELKKSMEEGEEALNESMKSIQAELAALRAVKVQKEEALKAPQDDLHEQEHLLEQLSKKILDAQTKMSRSGKDREERVQRINTITSQQERLKSNLDDLVLQEKKAKQGLDNVQASLDENKRRVDIAQNELKESYTQRDEYDRIRRASKDLQRNKKMGSIFAQKKAQGLLDGYIGNLWDIKIPQEYEKAFAACGANGDIFMTESQAVSEQLISIVREERLGRVSCVSIPDKTKRMKKRMEDVMIQRKGIPSDAVLLIDTIKDRVDPEILPVLFGQLTETLVVDNMDQARALAFGKTRQKVVTRNGAKIEKTGVISGGNVHYERRNQLVVPDAKAEEAVRLLIQKQEGYLQSVKDAEHKDSTAVRRVTDKLAELQTSVERAEEEILNMQQELETLKTVLDNTTDEDQTAVKNRLAEEIEKLAGQKKQVEQMIVPMQQQVSFLQIEVDEATAAVHSCGGPEVVAIREDQKLRKSSYTNGCKAISTLDKEILRLSATVQDVVESKIQLLNERIVGCEERLVAVNKKKQEVEKQAYENSEKQAKGKESHKQVQTELDILTQKLTEKRSANQELQLQQEDFKTKHNQLAVQKSTSEKEVSALRQSLDKIQKRWDSIPNLEAMGIGSQDKDVLAIEGANEAEEGDNDQGGDPTPKAPPVFSSSTPITHSLLNSLLDLDPELYKMLDLDVVQVQYEKCKAEMKDGSNPNYAVFKLYKQAMNEFQHRLSIEKELASKVDQVREALDKVQKKRLNEFMHGYAIISTRLKEIYQMITFGGDAEITFADSKDPFTAGILFSVRPPKKSWKQIRNLSGGEKTLSSLALIFALHHYNSSPIYFLDEIDAALDYRNVAIIAQALALRTGDTQFTIISLRNQMFERADRLLGTYKVDDSTNVAVIDPESLVEKENYKNSENPTSQLMINQ